MHLRATLADCADAMSYRNGSHQGYYLGTLRIIKNGQPLYFGSVKIGKNNISFSLSWISRYWPPTFSSALALATVMAPGANHYSAGSLQAPKSWTGGALKMRVMVSSCMGFSRVIFS